MSRVFSFVPVFTEVGFKERRGGLFSSPLKEFLKSLVSQDGFDCIISIPQLVMRPSFVDVGFAGLASLDNVFAALGFGNDVVAPGVSDHFAKFTCSNFRWHLAYLGANGTIHRNAEALGMPIPQRLPSGRYCKTDPPNIF